MPADTPTTIPLPQTTAAQGVSYTTPNSITIDEAGDYELSYQVNLYSSAGTDVTFAVQQNGSDLPETVTGRTMGAGAVTPINDSVIVSLPAGAEMSLRVTSPNAVDLTFISGLNASLTAKKLSAATA